MCDGIGSRVVPSLSRVNYGIVEHGKTFGHPVPE